MENVLSIDTGILIAGITGFFAIVGLLVKEYFDQKRSKQAHHQEQMLKVMHLYGKINALLNDGETDSAKSLIEFNDELKKMKSDPAIVGWMIGQLEILLGRAKAARDEITQLEREGATLEHQKKQYKKYYSSLFKQYQEERQKRVDAGEDMPDLPKWMYEMAERAKQD